jgi:hypothetical protein
MLIKIFLITCLLSKTLTQLYEYTLGTEIEETIDTTKFYTMTLDHKKNINSTLVIYLRPTNDYDEFSDPDIYVSLKNYYPKSIYNSEWHSTNVGRDIVTIPTAELVNSTNIYIGIECKTKKCKYEFKAEYQAEVALYLRNVIYTNFGNDTSMVFKYTHRANTSQLVEVFSIGSRMSDYQMKVYYVAGDGIEKNIQSFTTWEGGYSALIDTHVYFDCPECYFKIVMTGTPHSKFMVGTKQANETHTLHTRVKHFGSLHGDIIDCYDFNETKKEGQSNNFVFIGNSLRNSITLRLKPIGKAVSAADLINEFEYSLTKKFTYDELVDKAICLTSGKASAFFNSYVFTFIREENIEELGDISVFSGITQKGYLPPNKVLTYTLWDDDDMDNYKSMAMNLQVTKGNPVMYAYYCTDINCSFNYETVNTNVNLVKTPLVNGEYYLQILSQHNKCLFILDNCHTVMVVHCEGDQECEYNVSITVQKDELFLAEK